MNQRLAAVAVLALVLSGVTAAEAKPAPKPVCLLVTDVPGDGAAFGQVPASSLDIVSADIATGAKNLIAAVRLKTLQREAFLAGGATYTFTWSAAGKEQRLAYEVYATGETVGTYDDDNPATTTDTATVTAVADPTTSTITWTVPRKLVSTLKKPGTKFGALRVAASPATNATTPAGTTRVGYNPADTATTGKTYVDRTLTCLKGV